MKKSDCILGNLVKAGHQDVAVVGNADLALAGEVIDDQAGPLVLLDVFLKLLIPGHYLFQLSQPLLDGLFSKSGLLLLLEDLFLGPAALLSTAEHLVGVALGHYNQVQIRKWLWTKSNNSNNFLRATALDASKHLAISESA